MTLIVSIHDQIDFDTPEDAATQFVVGLRSATTIKVCVQDKGGNLHRFEVEPIDKVDDKGYPTGEVEAYIVD